MEMPLPACPSARVHSRDSSCCPVPARKDESKVEEDLRIHLRVMLQKERVLQELAAQL